MMICSLDAKCNILLNRSLELDRLCVLCGKIK